MALFCGWRFFVFISNRVPWFFVGIGKWKCPNRPPPILNTRGKLPHMIPLAGKYRKKMNLTQKFQLKNSPTTKISWLFAWPFQPLQTTWWKPPQLHWSTEASMSSSSFTASRQRHEKTPTGRITDVTAVSKKKMAKWLYGQFNIFCCASFLLLKKKSCNSNDIGWSKQKKLVIRRRHPTFKVYLSRYS